MGEEFKYTEPVEFDVGEAKRVIFAANIGRKRDWTNWLFVGLVLLAFPLAFFSTKQQNDLRVREIQALEKIAAEVAESEGGISERV
jgi:hypothetical protein